MVGNFNRKLRLPRIHFRVLLHAANMRHGTNGFTCLTKEGVLRIFFSPRKIRRLRPGLNPRTWIPKAITLPVDQPKPLLPTLNHSQMFYSRQTTVYNLFVHVCNTNDALMCLWTEATSGRRGNEIASILLKLLKQNFVNVSPPPPSVVIWCDNCFGKNKNQIVLLLMVSLVAAGTCTTFEQKFVLIGHSLLSYDQDFAVIEKRKK